MTAIPELSVVISTIGTPAVAETVESVADSAISAGRQVEILVVWSGAEQAPPLRDGVRVLEVFPVGLAHARNRGLEAATAPFVGFVDDDEVVDPAWVGAVLGVFAKDTEPAGVFGPIAPRDERGLPYCRHEGGGEFRLFGAGTPPWRIGSGGNMAFRRDVLLQASGFDPLFGLGSVARSAEETEVIFRLLNSGHVLAWSPDAVVYHPTKTEAERLESRFPYAFGLGKLVRRHRDAMLAVRYGKEIAQTLLSGVTAKDRRRLRETRETLLGFATGVAFRADARSPDAVLARAPETITAALDGAPVEPVEPSYRPDPHFVYRVGPDRLLHVYVNPTPRLREGFTVREHLRSELAVPGIPETFAVGEGVDALWVLEHYLSGRPPRPAQVAQWFGPVAEWVLALGAGRRDRVREGSWWADETEAAVKAAPPVLSASVAAALETVGELPSRMLHGDFQRKNILLGGGSGVGVLDWEHAYDAGPPGLDLLFLALMARSDRPDREMLLALARDEDPAWAPLRAHLRRAGVGDRELRPFLLAMLAVWAADEQARAASPGMPRTEPIYRKLLLDLGPELAR